MQPIKVHRCAQRGFSLAELLTVIVMIGLFMTIVVAILNPLTHASTQGQSKLETVQTPAQGFYEIQRDLREARSGSTFVCDIAGTTCATSGEPVIAVPTAMDQSGHVKTSNGVSQWQGYVVYWTSNGLLYRSYQSVTNMNTPTPNSSDALRAVQQANPSSPTASDTFLVGDYRLNATVSNTAVTLNMIARSTYGGAPNSTTYQSNVVPRNQ